MSPSSPPESQALPPAATDQSGYGGRRRRPRHRRLRRAFVRQLESWRRSLPGWVLPAAGIAIGVLALLAISGLSGARRELSIARSALAETRTAVASRDVAAADEALRQADEALSRAGAEARHPALRILSPVPLLGSPVRALSAGVSAGREVVKAGKILNAAADALPTSGNAALDGHDLTALRQAAVASDASLVKAAEHLEKARVALEGPAGALIPQVSSTAKGLLGEIDQAQIQLDAADRGLQLMAQLTNPQTDVRILLLSQDTMEMRPTGGFIGSWGVLRVAHGTITLEGYHSFEALPDPEPPMEAPPELAEVADRPFDLSNAGWWPDFPTTAKTAVELFRRQGGGAVDGVIAITEDTMARLLGVIGPIQLESYDKPVTEEGFAQRVLYEVELKRPQDNPRKKFLQELSDELFHRLFSLPADKVPAVVEAFGRSAGAGDVQAWFARPDWQAQISGSAIDGALPIPDEGDDFVLITEANMTASKANAEVTRKVEYTVEKAEGGRLKATLQIEYHNDGPETAVNPYYNGMVWVYVPHGVELVGSSGVVDDDPVAPYAVISDRVYVDPAGGKTILSFEYLLPEGTAPSGHYHLTWLRQPGMGRDSMTATVAGKSSDAAPGARRLTVAADLEKRGLSRFLPW